MKILKLQFKNINSLKGEHEVDFTQPPFVQNNLFAITGPTGSGKTTLLDVISLALFDMVPRLGSVKNSDIIKKGAILTRNQSEAYAEVTYSCTLGEFRSRWEISTARTGNLRDYEMLISEIATDSSLDLKKSEVPAKNEELIGLNYEQFIKSVVLAQGDFAKFLQVPKKERGALLEKITGTGIYRELGRLAFLKYNELEKDVSEQKIKIKTHEEQLIPEEEYKQKYSLAESQKAKKQELVKKLDLLQLQIKDKENLTKLLDAKQELLEQQEKNKVQWQDFQEEKGLALQKHLELQSFTEEIHQWKNDTKQLIHFEDKKEEIEEKLRKLNIEIQENKTQFLTVFGLEITENNFQESLTNYKQKLRTLYQKRGSILSEYKGLGKNIGLELKEFQIELNIQNPFETLQQVESFIQQNKKELESLKTRYSFTESTSVELEQEKIQLQLKKIRTAEKSLLEIQEVTKELDKLSKEIALNTDAIKDFPSQIEDLEQQEKLLSAQLEAKENAQKVSDLQKKLEDYRQDLAADMPCPLCGSKEHPFATHLPATENDLELTIKKLRTHLKKCQQQLTKISVQLAEATKKNKQLESSISQQKKQLKTKRENYQTTYSEQLNLWKERSFEDLEDELNTKYKALQAFGKLHQQEIQLEKNRKALLDLSELLTQGTTVKDEIKAHYHGKDFETEISNLEQSYLKAHQSIAQLQENKQENLNALNKLEAQHESRSTHLLGHLTQLKYSSIAEAIKNLLSHSLVSQYQEEKQRLKNLEISLETRLKESHKQEEILNEKVVERPLKELKTKLETLQNQLQKLEEELLELQRILKNQDEYQSRIAQLKEKISEQLKRNKRWEILRNLIGDSTGNKFNDYAQDLTLSQLLMLANKRLALLTDRYKMDKPLADEDDSLVAIDEHMGGQRRSVKTLSGGETFLLSLALALALSDFASRNVEINSLFIDEGFGTLDPETLDQTLDTLEVLQAKSSKMIGVISHVASLKERIATQIQLSQNGQGYSSLKVV
ncbi:SbcC/MukB-like Walker B domain-containing protein [Mesonia ostreae]|uniref:AAA family ATPase n=1 Tax=Mesonia ostreae TaxID=861110 RepID=A0ABU2KKK4_9FLAO|nr:AAA family ATPase [Mesonia ostreae]MDT0295193.1 AAA family ATPase [Mesonia ostreae]